LCNIQSNLRYTADQSDSEISCYAQQTDTFGDILHSNEQFIDVIIESKGISELSSGIKAAIAISVIILILIIIALILFLAWYFGWCCWKDRKKKSEKQELKVNDQPTENQPTNAERVIEMGGPPKIIELKSDPLSSDPSKKAPLYFFKSKLLISITLTSQLQYQNLFLFINWKTPWSNLDIKNRQCHFRICQAIETGIVLLIVSSHRTSMSFEKRSLNKQQLSLC
jgi:hypothetical protein